MKTITLWSPVLRKGVTPCLSNYGSDPMSVTSNVYTLSAAVILATVADQFITEVMFDSTYISNQYWLLLEIMKSIGISFILSMSFCHLQIIS